MKILLMSYRISGNDGVSLECEHWKKILSSMGHEVVLVGGELDNEGTIIPELHFRHEKVQEHHDNAAYGDSSFKDIEASVNEMSGVLEGKLRDIFEKEKPDMLAVMNILSIPMNMSLAQAFTKVTSEMNIPVIARHNDFWWERERYRMEDFKDYFSTWFPANKENFRHIVINSEAGRQLKKRLNIDSFLIEDSFDYDDESLRRVDDYAKSFKTEFGINDDEIVFLQATRIVPRKRIELSIKLFKRLSPNNAVLVFAGRSGDEGVEYEKEMRELAGEYQINAKFIGERIDTTRKEIGGSKVFTLWDAYNNSDFILYPSEIEGFGNQFLEAVYFKKPVILTPYPVFLEDILPKGFETINFSPEIKEETLGEIKYLMEPENRKVIEEMVIKNFEIARQNYSYKVTAQKIQRVIDSFK